MPAAPTARRLNPTAAPTGAWARRLDRFCYAGLLVLLVWMPVPLASNRPWALSLLAMLTWVLLLLRLALDTFSPHFSTPPASAWLRLRQSALPLVLLAGFSVLLVGQLVTGHTIDPFKTRFYLLTSLTYLGLFALTLLCLSSSARVQRLLITIVAAGLLQAVLGVVLFSAGSYEYLFTDFPNLGRATGTFANPDHLAGYMELTLSAGLGLMLAQFGGKRQPRGQGGWQQATQATLAFVLSTKMLLRIVLVIMVVALVMTHSRMGNGAFFITILLMGALVAATVKRLRRPALWLVASMALIDVVIIGQWVGLERVLDRLQDTVQSTSLDAAQAKKQAQTQAQTQAEDADDPADALSLSPEPRAEESVQQRLKVPSMALPLIQAKPWFGHGGGGFELAFPAVKPPGVPLLWDHAHNDYVEIAADTGLVGLALLLGVAGATTLRSARVLRRNSHNDIALGAAIAQLTAICCMALHSMVDFNLQIPANAGTLTVMLATVWAYPSLSRSPS